MIIFCLSNLFKDSGAVIIEKTVIMICCAGVLNIYNHPMRAVFCKQIKSWLHITNWRSKLFLSFHMVNLHRKSDDIAGKCGKYLWIAECFLENNTVF